MRSFTYTSHQQRVIFGADSLHMLKSEIEALGLSKALLLCTPEQRDQAERKERSEPKIRKMTDGNTYSGTDRQQDSEPGNDCEHFCRLSNCLR